MSDEQRDLVCERCDDASGEFCVPFKDIGRITSDRPLRHEEPCVLCPSCRETVRKDGWQIDEWDDRPLPAAYRSE